MEKYFPDANNNRYKPYYEDGKIVYKSPYFFKVSPRVDSLMLMKVINNFSRKFFLKKINNDDMQQIKKDAWNTTDLFIGKISQLFENDVPKIALISNYKVSSIYEKNDFITIYSKVPKALTGLPKDSHPTSDGHAYMIKSILPIIKENMQ